MKHYFTASFLAFFFALSALAQAVPGLDYYLPSGVSYDPAIQKPKEVLADVMARVEKAGYTIPIAQIDLPITGMTCANCVATVERTLNRLDGVVEATVNFASERASVTFVPGIATRDDLVAAVEDADLHRLEGMHVVRKGGPGLVPVGAAGAEIVLDHPLTEVLVGDGGGVVDTEGPHEVKFLPATFNAGGNS